ncbi:MAG: tRNA uridine-5-carboxymethylaminomethyl(34) synthesis GTPase MnmE, partial [Erysipelotrichaceae bacterium]|nr:tRNA uridine-5-carboxymethylaminomethyl(34) synthesis GTPase MnmE [Erysipelotrichaceae bacterium]
MLNDTICAISTALKEGAISIVRMSGDESFEIIRKISDVKTIKPNTIVYSHIRDEGEIIDEVLISFFAAGKSYTLEDMVEINCHGGIYVTRLILNLLLKNGCRLAEAGEFTKRAYLNGRIDLSEADSINDLIKAQSMIQAKSAIRGVNGSIERLLDPLMKQMKDVIAMIEVNIDYPEYEDEVQMSNEVIAPYIDKWIAMAEDMIDKAERFRLVKDGLNTVIIGKPNVGKSSLLNALLQKDKAIVTDIAGTTRDLVEGKVALKNVTLNLIDTAGIRQTGDKVEAIGVERARKACDEADIVVYLAACDENEEEILRQMRELYSGKDNSNVTLVFSKSDLGINPGSERIKAEAKSLGITSVAEVSTDGDGITGAGTEPVRQIITEFYEKAGGSNSSEIIVLAKRHSDLLASETERLDMALATAEGGLGVDIMSSVIRASLDDIGKIT